MANQNFLFLVCEEDLLLEKANQIASHIGIEVKRELPSKDFDGLFLRLDESGLSLNKKDLSVKGDFEKLIPRLKKENLNGEMLIKASRLADKKEKPTLVDATAGLGEDSFLLAGYGFFVTLFEYDKIIYCLLADAMERGKSNPILAPILERMTLINGDSVEGLKHLDFEPDVVLLDPMFPERSKSGLIKKKFQLLQCLEAPCTTAEELLESAYLAKPHKIVIKRPMKGELLGGKKPSFSIGGKAIRYDCIVIAK